MDLTRENFRAMIYFRRGLTKKQCIDRLTSIFGDEAPSKTTVHLWFSEFNLGRSMIADKSKEGRPKSIVVSKNIDAVRELIMQDRHVTYCEIKTSLVIKVLEKIRKDNLQRRIILHHGNCSCHTSAETTWFLEGQKIELTGHPPCSLDSEQQEQQFLFIPKREE
ncbi:hypothetical protein EVAR_13202_1 [Eumeta japonica]|uniref:Mos1 transposase HTH domain-containing protein n=1 Tax=Eumeta variegata TaxID=151549 RepID=A0A4C1TS55_EUMVA|nr:hypothetical protein EVAR_13202_1 [Eumeta japonica]